MPYRDAPRYASFDQNPNQKLVVHVAIFRVNAGKLELLAMYKPGKPCDLGVYGRIETGSGENPQSAALREVLEETSVSATARSLIPLTYLENDDSTYKRYAMEAPPGCKIKLSQEHERCEWVSAGALLASQRDGVEREMVKWIRNTVIIRNYILANSTSTKWPHLEKPFSKHLRRQQQR